MRCRSAGVSAGGRRLLDDLLVPPLNRAFALEEMNDVALGVGENLELDVAGAVDEPLDVERSVAERRKRFATCLRDCGSEVRLVPHGLHPDSAAAFRRLEEERESDPTRGVGDGGVALLARRFARHHRRAGLSRQLPRRHLRAHRRDDVRGRADEGEAIGRARRREVLVLGQETVAGMNGVSAGRTSRPR